MAATLTMTLPLELLSDDDLMNLRDEADRLLEARNTASLPGKVLEAVKDVLAEDEPDAPAPVSAEFTTREWEDGFFWNDGNPTVTLVDGSTRTLDLSGRHRDLDGALTDHSGWIEPNDNSTLLVTFEPLALEPCI
ncbi:hypothetical protein ACIQVL_03255 [Streptomyces sp. NPDC090499]|uniref:hypothetical protein n=1 Tax=Streptomyces sp. NPDC090499 TaxID=3365965 RepID=UPI003803C065